MTKNPDELRIIRLVGTGKASEAGALPLSDAFRGVMEQVLDEEGASFADLVKRVTDEMHKSNERRIFARWGSWDDFTIDVVAQLSYRKLIHPKHDPEDAGTDTRWVTGMTWHLPDDIVPGKFYNAITVAEVRKATGDKEALSFRVIFHDAGTRAALNVTSKALTATRKFRSELERLGRLDEDRDKLVSQLVASLEGEGPSPAVEKAKRESRLPADDPDTRRVCIECKVPKPLTRLNYTPRWQDRPYWDRKCRECQHPRLAGQRKAVQATVGEIVQETGDIPPTRDVATRTKLTHGSVQKIWDDLTAYEDLPSRNKKTAA